MKIGIITLYGEYNYGNKLQNYALEQTLKKYGEVETIVLNPSAKNERIVLDNRPAKSLMAKRKKNFAKFSSKFLNVRFVRSLDKISNEYDYFVVGSDQIWNPVYCHNYSKKFLQFAPTEKCVAYSPSFGITKLGGVSRKRKTIKGLKHIKHLSVREDSGAKIIKDLIGVDAPVLIDPTMLLSKEEWSKNFAKANGKKPKKYLLTYFLGNTKNYFKKIEQIAKNFNLEIVDLNCKKHKDLFTVSPNEFVDYIKNAELVCTDSFHGSVFSILFEKPFVVFERKGIENRIGSRIVTLLSKMDLNERRYSTLKEEDYFNIDFKNARKNLEVERAKSKKFIDGALQ